MRWIRVLGGLAVLLVLFLGLGTLASLATSNDVLVSSAVQVPALACLAVLVVAFVLTLVSAGPEASWTENPYW